MPNCFYIYATLHLHRIKKGQADLRIRTGIKVALREGENRNTTPFPAIKMPGMKVALFSLTCVFALKTSCSPTLNKRFVYVGATPDVEQGSGPNGGEDWFNTGMNNSGWNPPYMGIADVQHISLAEFYSGAGQGCSQYDSYFQAAASQYNTDPVFYAVIAMQESSCDATATGPTPGLMQVACQNYVE
jgi:hypothetical protein